MIKALSVRQPWAWAILSAGKDVENRVWNTRYRGPLLIHASGTRPPDVRLPEWSRQPEDDLPFGAIVGVVDLVGVVRFSSSRWFEGPYGFVLENPRSLVTPWPCAGYPGLWDPAPKIADVCRRAGLC